MGADISFNSSCKALPAECMGVSVNAKLRTGNGIKSKDATKLM